MLCTVNDKTKVENIDCMVRMREFPDKFFELAIIDAPYGINWMNQIQNPNLKANWKAYENKEWDNCVPTEDYFNELYRISVNQIIWGANYYSMPPSPCWVIWDKLQEFSGAEFEMAWTSFTSPSKAFRYSRVEAYTNQEKIHPTQKPIKLYKWLLKNYAKEGDKILDSHCGSQSSRIASFDGGFEFWGYELDESYFIEGNKRFENHKKQLPIIFNDNDSRKKEVRDLPNLFS